jgi:predicted transposase YbfD/YdcC
MLCTRAYQPVGAKRTGIDAGRIALPKKTVEAIVDGGNDYVIQVKGNQKELYRGIEQTIEHGEMLDEYKKEEKNKGRLEKRRVRLYDYDDRFITKSWKNVHRIIEVVNEGIRNQKGYYEKHYYISSLKDENATVFAEGIRRHWSIENELHWVKDVIQNEDDCLIQHKSIVANLSLVKSVVISIFRQKGFKSTKKAIERFKNRVPDCCDLIGFKYI